MCETLRLLGENHEAILPANFSERCNVWLGELAELGRAKLGLEVSTRCEPDGLIVLELGEGRAVGVKPWWCTRSVERVEPLRLALRFSSSPRESDGLHNFKVSIFERDPE